MKKAYKDKHYWSKMAWLILVFNFLQWIIVAAVIFTNFNIKVSDIDAQEEHNCSQVQYRVFDSLYAISPIKTINCSI